MNPDLSVIIPVYREQLAIQPCLDYLARCPGIERCEVIVVDGDGGSTHTPTDILPVTVLQSPPGRGQQLNAGARSASAGALLFLHVDTVPPLEFVHLITTALQFRVAGAFDLHIVTRHPVTAVVSWTGRIRSRITRIPYGDQAQFIRTTTFHDIGGFSDEPIMEDVALMDKLKAAGHRIRFVRPAARTSDRRWRSEGVIRGTLRNWKLLADYRRGVPPSQLRERYQPRPHEPRLHRRRLPPTCRVLVFYRTYRIAGVKTRLAAAVGESNALALYKAMLGDIIHEITPISPNIIPFADDPAAGVDPFLNPKSRRWEAEHPRPQRGGTLELRMQNALADVFAEGAETAILFGTDIPGLGAEHIFDASRALETHDAVIGPCVNAGYYLIGFRRSAFTAVFEKSHGPGDPGERLVEFIEARGLSVASIRRMRDVDTIADLNAVIASPQGRQKLLNREHRRIRSNRP